MKILLGLLYLIGVVGGVAAIFQESVIGGLILVVPVLWLMFRKM